MKQVFIILYSRSRRHSSTKKETIISFWKKREKQKARIDKEATK